MHTLTQTRCAVWLLCCFIGISMGFMPLHAESTVINLGHPDEDAQIAHIYEVGTYAYDPQASAECLGTWSRAADTNSDNINLANLTHRTDKTPSGDLDGDGFDDLIIAGFFHTDRGMNPVNLVEYPQMKWIKRSALWLVFGGADFGETDQYLDRDLGNSQNTLVSFSGPYFTNEEQMSRPFYLWGYHGIECADMNQDGFDDVVILGLGSRPVPDPNVVDTTLPMFVWNLIIVYGGPEIRSRFIDMDDPNDLANVTIIELPRQENDAPAYSRILRESNIAVGDFNADSYPDIAFGKYWRNYAPDSPFENRGAVTILLGGVYPKGETVSITDTRFASRVSEIYGVRRDSDFGRRLEVGEVNGDGIDDILVGYIDITHEDPFDVYEGSVAIMYGDPAIQTQNGPFLDLNFQTAPTRLVGITSQGYTAELIASDIATGDENMDGYDDLLVGHFHDGWNNAYGRTVTLPGSPTLPGATMLLRDSAGSYGETYTRGTWTMQPNPGPDDMPLGADDLAGTSVSFVDFNADGIDDRLIWAKQPFNAFLEPEYFGFSFGRCFILKSPVVTPTLPIELANSADIRVESSVYVGCNPYPFYFPAKWTGFPFSGGDLNRDGFAEFGNCSQLGRAPDHYDLVYTDIWGSFEVIMGQATPDLPASAHAVERFKAGYAPTRGFGGRTSPVLRAHLAFADGDGVSPVTATLTRNNVGIGGMGVTRIGKVHWKFESPRTGWTEATIRLQYTDSEVDGLREETSKLFQAQSLSGPWTEVANQSQDLLRNEFTVKVSALGHFAIGDVRDFSPLRLLSPNGGEELTRGRNVTVSWSSTGTVGNKIRIELWRRGSLVTVLKAKATNDGAETVMLSASLAAKNGYVIKVYDAKNRSVADTSNKPFRIVKPS